MLGNRKQRAMKIHNIVTALAAVAVRCASKLPVMGILVAVGAGCEFHLIDRVLARG